MLTQEEVKRLFDYDNGVLYWKEKTHPKSHIKIGDVAGSGTSSNGYWIIMVNQKLYLRSNLVWIYHNGEIPEGKNIDHINRIKHDDRIENLRLVSHMKNMQNYRNKNNTSGIRGVSWHNINGGWRAQIQNNGKKHVGSTRTDFIQAVKDRFDLERKYNWLEYKTQAYKYLKEKGL